MAITNISRRTLAGLLAGAAAAQAIAAEHGEDELPKDTIRQEEIACLFGLEAAKDVICRSFLARIEAGATVEPGPYSLDPSGESYAEICDAPIGISGFGAVPGFDFINF